MRRQGGAQSRWQGRRVARHRRPAPAPGLRASAISRNGRAISRPSPRIEVPLTSPSLIDGAEPPSIPEDPASMHPFAAAVRTDVAQSSAAPKDRSHRARPVVGVDVVGMQPRQLALDERVVLRARAGWRADSRGTRARSGDLAGRAGGCGSGCAAAANPATPATGRCRAGVTLAPERRVGVCADRHVVVQRVLAAPHSPRRSRPLRSYRPDRAPRR